MNDTTIDGDKRPVRVLAVSSAGGHWVQLRRLRPAWQGCDVAYATSNPEYRHEVEADADPEEPMSGNSPPRFYVFPEATRWNKLRLLRQLLKLFTIIIRERPDVVVSTGAAAGYFALRIAKLMGRRTIWVDSIANAAELSLAGKKVGPHADLWLTQWPQLAGARDGGTRSPEYRGAVI